MKKAHNLKSKSNQAFTLIEIIIVVAIISAACMVAIPNYLNARERMIADEGYAILRTLLGAQKRFFQDNNVYTAVINNLDVTIPAARNFNAPVVFAAGDDAVALARIQRNDASYMLFINGGGQFACSPLANCQRLGYTDLLFH